MSKHHISKTFHFDHRHILGNGGGLKTHIYIHCITIIALPHNYFCGLQPLTIFTPFPPPLLNTTAQIHKYTNTQTHKYSHTQIQSYTNTQLLTILHPSSTPLHWEWIRIDLNLLFIFISTLFQYYTFSSFFCNDDFYDQHLSVHHDVLCLDRKAEVRKSQKRNTRSGLKIPT